MRKGALMPMPNGKEPRMIFEQKFIQRHVYCMVFYKGNVAGAKEFCPYLVEFDSESDPKRYMLVEPKRDIEVFFGDYIVQINDQHFMVVPGYQFKNLFEGIHK